MMGYSQNGYGGSRDHSSSSRGYDHSRNSGVNSRGYENSRDQDFHSRGYGNSRDQGSNSRGYGEASQDYKENSQREKGDSWGRGSLGYGGDSQGYNPEAHRRKGYSPTLSSESKSYGESNYTQASEPKAYGAEPKGYTSGSQSHRAPRSNPNESKGYDGDAYSQSEEHVSHREESGGYGSAPAEYDFTFEDKLYINCTQKFRPDDVCHFFRSFGAFSVETDQEGEVVSNAKIQFKTKEEAEKVFAIWHSKFSLPFHCRMFFSRTSNPQLRENGPATTKLVVLGLPLGFDEWEIYDMFRPIGPMYDCSLTYSVQSASQPSAILHFINDELNEQAIAKFNGMQFQGQQLTVELFDKIKHFDSNSRTRTPLKANESYRVEVTGFPSDYDQATLLKYFKTVGEIICVDFDGPSSKCMLNYDTAMGAFGAIQRFNNYRAGPVRFTVKSTGRPEPKPYASIPLIDKSHQATSAVPSSRDVKNSRWSQKADESSHRQRKNNYSGSNSGSQYGDRPADFSFTSGNSFNQPRNSDSQPAPSTSHFGEESRSAIWNAPIAEQKKNSWDAPGGKANSDWNTPAAEPKATGWDAPVAEPNVNNSWEAPVLESKSNEWNSPAVESKPSDWNAPVVESKSNGRNAPAAESKSTEWNTPVVEHKDGSTSSNHDQSIGDGRFQASSKATSNAVEGESNRHSPSPSRSSTPQQMTLTQFLESNLSAPFVGLVKSLSPGSENTVEQIIKSLFEKTPEKIVALACTIQDMAAQVKEVEAKLQNIHQFSISEEAYHRIKKASEGRKINCNYEYFPLHPQKEMLLKQLMMAPKDQSYRAMASLLAKRLSQLGFSDTVPKAQAIVEKSSLRLIMVAYSYDDVLQDLHDKLNANQTRP